ncbi:MAG: hypothetical protein IJ100_05880, partial [Lachnospiraceae bacterium]|nr:hypothetical protein [Lachnospiraceae bacterium]
MKDERHVRQRRAEGKKWRPAAILLAGVLAFLSLPITGKAADTGSAPLIGALTVAPGNVEMVQDISTSNLQIDVYRIADAQKVAGYDTYEWINTAPFGTVNIPNSPDTTSDQWKATAQEAAAIILGAPQEGGTEWNPSSTAARVQETIGLYVSKKMAEGETSVRFDGLPAGMYLVLAHGTDINHYAVSVQDAESSG